MNEPLIRECSSPDEIDELTLRNWKVFNEEFGFNEEYLDLVKILYCDYFDNDDPRQNLWIVEEDGRILGGIAVFRESEDVARLRLLFVDPSIRRRGVGKDLMDRAIEFARDHGYDSIVLMTEEILEDAARLYRRFGFELKRSAPMTMWGRSFQLQTYERAL